MALNSDEDVANTQQAKRRRGLPLEEPPESAVVASQSVGLAATDLELLEAQATEILIKKRMRMRDDTMVKRLLETRKMETMTKKHGETDIGLLLSKKAEAEFAAAEERKKANLESKRRRAREDWDQKAEAARLQAAADDKRIEHLRVLAEDRREKQRLRKQQERQKVEERWLQVDFPVELARRCIDWYAALSQDPKTKRNTHVLWKTA